MSKLTFEQADNLSKGGTAFFKLSDGETKSVRFLYNKIEDIEAYSVHEFNSPNNFATIECCRDEGDPIDSCKWCAMGNKPKAVVVLPVYLVEEDSIQYWKRTFKWVKDNLIPIFNNMPANAPISGQIFSLGRTGKSMQDTVYTAAPDLRVMNDMKTRDAFGEVKAPAELNIIRPNDYDFDPTPASQNNSNGFSQPNQATRRTADVF